MVKVALASESATGALADQHALQNALIEMDEWGHHLHGLFHSHPGKGDQATRPSSTDLATHERYEIGGYPLVGAIFVKGFVRFFGHHPFTITIYGKGVERIDTHLFVICNLSH
ncbi:MAG: Mov34/MPN/PAD-1 family protein [Burkholderiales bacterium]